MSVIDKIKKIINSEKKDKYSVLVTRYKALTISDPTNSNHWYNLSLGLFSSNKNNDAWKALTNAQKLGSERALELINIILTDYANNNPSVSSKAKNLLFGEGV